MSIKPVKFESTRAKKHRETADMIHNHLSADDNVISEKKPGGAFEQHLESRGLEIKQVKELDKARNDFCLGATLAFSEMASGMFKKDKKLESVECSIEAGGRMKFNDRIAREKSFRSPSFGGSGGSSEPVVKSLVHAMTVGSDVDRGVKALRNELSEEAAKFF